MEVGRPISADPQSHESVANQRFRAFADRLPFMVWQHDASGSITYTNTFWHEATGLPREPLSHTAVAWRRIIHPDDFDWVVASLESGVRERTGYRFDFRQRHVDGDELSYRWYAVAAAPDTTPDEEFDGLTGYATDIHESHDGNVLFRRFFDANIIGILLARISGEIVDANDEFLRLIGYSRSDLNARRIDWRTMTPPEWAEADARSIAEIREHGYNVPFEKEYYRKDGSRVPILLGVSLLPGTDETTVCYALDLTAAKRTRDSLTELNRRLHTSEQHFRTMADGIPVMSWTARADGFIDWYNAYYYEYTGQTFEEACGWGWQRVHHPDSFAEVVARWTACIASGTPFEMEFRIRRADGAFRWFLTRANPYRNERGDIVRWYGSNIDMHAQRESLDRSSRIAETLQRAFLPTALPDKDGLRCDSLYIASEQDALVGGDWYDALELPDGRFVFCIGDVAGHGVNASVIAGRLRQTVVDFALDASDPAEVLGRMNRVLRFQHPDTYVTAIVAFVDAEKTRFTIASAGHPPALFAYDDARPPIRPSFGGPPLGVLDKFETRSWTQEIRPNLVVALYTDGLIENERKIEEAEGRLSAVVRDIAQYPSRHAQPALAIGTAVLGGQRPVDDVAVLVVRFSAQLHGTSPNDVVQRRKQWWYHASDAYAAQMSRRELTAFVASLAADPLDAFTAEVILGELIANTVRYAPGLVEIVIDWMGDAIDIAVRDTGPGITQPQAAVPVETFAERGRGLDLVRSIATRVVIAPRPERGTEVRVELAIARRP